MGKARETKILSAKEIAETLKAKIIGDDTRWVSGTEYLERAKQSDLGFVACQKNLKRVKNSRAQLVIAPEGIESELEQFPDITFVVVAEPETAFLIVAQQLAPKSVRQEVGISPRAFVSESAVIGSGTRISPLAYIGNDVQIGSHCEIGPGVVIEDGCVIGDHVQLDANVTLYSHVVLGSHVTIKASAVIGGAGFGYRTVNGQHQRLPHVGTVRIADDVEIGSCTVVDRAKVGQTTIERGTRIDNLVMIAHNCQIGKHNLLLSQTGIAGSSTTGEYVICAGQAGVADHVHLADHAVIGAKTGVYKDLPGGQAYLGIPARQALSHHREQASLKQLPELRSTVKELKKQQASLLDKIQQLEQRLNQSQPCPPHQDSDSHAA
ncbi:MAG: UDP-3-O-(3-hydroxymyristoyl)glucosamine N-acyltransferase [Fuerstiella sp.]